MLIENSFFELGEADGYLRCDKGLFEGKELIDLNEVGWKNRKLINVTAKKTRIVDFNITFPPPDFLITGPLDYCLSERAFEAFKAAKLNLWLQFEWTPVTIVGFFGEFIGTYWWPKRLARAYDVFDYEHAEYSTYSNKKVWKEVFKWVLRRDLIGSLDFFYGCSSRWWGSPRLKQVVEENKLLGFEFIPVATWAPPNSATPSGPGT